MAACFLKFFCPDNIVLLIKSCLQLNEYGYLFSILCRCSQGRDDRGISADTVEGLLDRQHFRISRRSSDKVHNRIKGLVRMHQKNITFPDIRKDIIVIHQCRNRLRRIFRCLQMIVSVKSVHLHKDRQIQSARNLEDVFLVDFQLPF